MWVTQGGVVHMDEMTQKGNSTGGCDVVAGAQRAEERPWGGARESWSTGKVEGVTGNGKCWSRKNVKKASDQVLARIYCNDQFPQSVTLHHSSTQGNRVIRVST